jgi:hypothetical protein
MKKKTFILIGVLLFLSLFLVSATTDYSQTLSEDYCAGGRHNPVLEFTQTPKPGGDGTLTIKARGDYSYPSLEYIDVVVEGTNLGRWAPNTCDCCVPWQVLLLQLLEVSYLNGPPIEK